MGNNVFADWAQKYWEQGFNVIPVRGKIPLIKEWQRFSTERQTQEMIDALIENFPRAQGISIVCGDFGCALDVDSDDERLNAAAPESPISKKGRKGFTRLYRHIGLRVKHSSLYPLDLLSYGSHTVMPPSVYPLETDDTTEQLVYHFLPGSDVVELKDLPEFSEASWAHVQNECKRMGILKTGLKRVRSDAGETVVSENYSYGPGNRYNFLSRMAYAIACEGVTPSEGAERLLRADQKFHPGNEYFSDMKESKGLVADQFAQEFYERAVKAAGPTFQGSADIRAAVAQVQANLAAEEPPIVKPIITIEERVVLTDQEKMDHEFNSLIPAHGIMNLAYDYCRKLSQQDMPALSFGGVISLTSILSANRMQFAGTWPNVYVINLAKSGTGKGAPQAMIRNVLHNSDMGGGLVGYKRYKSVSSLYLNIEQKRERIDIQDEVTGLLKKMGEQRGSNDFQELAQELCDLYSSSNTRIDEMAAMTKTAQVAAVWHPCVTFFGSGTIKGFEEAFKQSFADLGLAGRIMFFCDVKGLETDESKIRLYGEHTEDLSPAPELLASVNDILNKPIEYENVVGVGGRKARPYNLKATPGAWNRLRQIEAEMRDRAAGLDDGHHLVPTYNRGVENIRKLLICYATSQGVRELSGEHVDWARSVWLLSLKSVERSVRMSVAQGDSAKAWNKLEEVRDGLRAKGVHHISRRDLWRSVRRTFNEDSVRFDRFLASMQANEVIRIVEEVIDQANGRARGKKIVEFLD